jgi:hypothetical protein
LVRDWLGIPGFGFPNVDSRFLVIPPRWDSTYDAQERSSDDEQLLIRPFFFAKNEKYEHGGRLIFKISILF